VFLQRGGLREKCQEAVLVRHTPAPRDLRNKAEQDVASIPVVWQQHRKDSHILPG
jgi:hypothetical protein